MDVRLGKWQVSVWKRVSGAAEVRFRERRFNMDFNLGVHRYIYGDYGVRVDCIRHFGRTTAGLYAMYTGGEANGGFHFAVPLPQWGKCACRNITRWNIRDRAVLNTSAGNSDRTTRLGRMRAIVFLMIGGGMIYDLLLKREIEDEYCLINNIMFYF